LTTDQRIAITPGIATKPEAKELTIFNTINLPGWIITGKPAWVMLSDEDITTSGIPAATQHGEKKQKKVCKIKNYL
jgi:hypothetical protein